MISTTPAIGQHFAYGYGRIGVLQQYFLSQSDIDRLLGAHSDAQLLQILGELNLTQDIEPVLDPRELTIRLERNVCHEVMKMSTPDKASVFDILWLRNDGALLSYLLKKHHGLTSSVSSEPLGGAHAYPPQALKELVQQGRTRTDLPHHLLDFVRDMRSLKNATPHAIDDHVAQFVAHEQLRLANKSGSDLVKLYVKHHIDLQNIRTARRLRRDDDPNLHLIDGGRIPTEDISADPQKLALLIRSSHLPSELADSLADTDESSIALERGLAKAIAHDIAAMRDKVLSIDPVFAYATIALSQIRVLRTIVIGKSMKLQAAEIKQLLPPFLSASPFAS